MRNAISRRAHVLTVLNLKGGVGKTHMTWLVASVCQEQSRRILLIDTDTQGNLSNSFMGNGPRTPGVEQLIDPTQEPEIERLIRPTEFSSIDLIPASAAVAAFDLSRQADWEAFDLHRSFVDPVEAIRDQYDFIVFDCPPRLSLVSFAALVASDAVIVPLEAADWGAQGIRQVAQAVDYVRSHHHPALRLLGYVLSRYKAGRTFQRTYEAELRSLFGAAVFDTMIPDLAGFERAVTLRRPITEREPRSRGAAVAREFFAEVVRRLEAGGR
jgi:chromosome partitioning protein